MELRRAWATLEIKSFDQDTREFEGIASTPSMDHGGDIHGPAWCRVRFPMPLMWQHGKQDIKDPVGGITHAEATDAGIKVRGFFAKLDEPPSLKEQLERVFALVKAKLVRGLSIGWSPKEYVPIKGNLARWDGSRNGAGIELSAVAIPMNSQANILTVKAMDQAALAKSGATAPPPIAVTHSAAVVSAIPERKANHEHQRAGSRVRGEARCECGRGCRDPGQDGRGRSHDHGRGKATVRGLNAQIKTH